jgi:hypothetical protein
MLIVVVHACLAKWRVPAVRQQYEQRIIILPVPALTSPSHGLSYEAEGRVLPTCSSELSTPRHQEYASYSPTIHIPDG